METFVSHPEFKPSSDRMFGGVMATFFFIVAVFPTLSDRPLRGWALVIAVTFLCLAMLFPKTLSLLNTYWTKLGLFLSAIVSPIALGVLFFGVITPYGWLMKKLGKSFIPTYFDPKAESYWITRDPAGPAPESLNNQF